MEHSYVIDFWSIQLFYQAKHLSDIVMFNGDLNVQLEVKLLKFNHPNLTLMHGVENTVPLFFNYVSKLPIVHQMVSSHK